MRLSRLLPALLLAAAAPAAAQQPVQWRLARDGQGALQPGDRLRLRLTARMDTGWYIYSLTQGPGGPFPLRITLADPGPVRLAGPIATPTPERHHDPNFGIVTETYHGVARFGLPAVLTGDPGRDTAVALVRYQTCNDRICLPPHTDSVRLALAEQATAAPAGGRASSRISTPQLARAPIGQSGSDGRLARRQFAFPVLLDDGYAMRAGVMSFPTTWFLNRQGRIVYMEKRGNSGDSTFEEAVWRIEALRASQPAAKAAPKP